MVLLIALGKVTTFDVIAAWVFVAGRVIHTLVQTLTDNVPLRGQVFMINFLAVVALAAMSRCWRWKAWGDRVDFPRRRRHCGEAGTFTNVDPVRPFAAFRSGVPDLRAAVLDRPSAHRGGPAWRCTTARDVALREPNWGKRETQIANAYHNQLELPLLFYVLTILAWITKRADLLFVVLAWVFVVLRSAHAFIHVTSNHLTRRFAAFAASVIVLAIMWAIFIVRILLA